VDRDADAILQQIAALIERLVGMRPGHGPDALIGADFGVEGWDGIELLEELEATYGVDLRPFVDGRAKAQRFLFWKIKTGADTTPRELAQHIAALLSRR
jgi:hypothetical protein